jgi:hypothetical protein
MSRPKTTHWDVAKGVIRYLAATADKGLTYRGSNTTPEGFCDSDYAGDGDTRRSTTGYVFIMNNGAVSWCSKRQSTVAASTTEAEYMAAAAAIKEGLWIQKMMHSLDIPTASAITIKCDNQGAIKLLKNPIYSARSKHIDVIYHFAREHVLRGHVKIDYVATNKMTADVLTKALPPQMHKQCTTSMGIM